MTEGLYKPLDRTLKEIRLLTLHAGEPGAVITCSLTTVRLSDNPPPEYTTLSYTWGSPYRKMGLVSKSILFFIRVKLPRKIILCGRPFVVRQNLSDALIQLRSALQDQILWIDAICINQDDIEERSNQVSFMGEIYSKARLVRVWLGMAEEKLDARLAFKTLADISRNPEQYKSCSLVKYSICKKRMNGDNLRECDPGHRWHSYARNPILHVLAYRYWRWVWAIQEYTFARQITIHAGKYSIDGITFEAAIEHPALFPDRSMQTYAAVQLSLNRKTRRSVSLATLINSHLLTEAGNRKDKVYALLSLASDVHPGDIEVDYRKSCEEIWFDIMTFICLRSASKDIDGITIPIAIHFCSSSLALRTLDNCRMRELLAAYSKKLLALHWLGDEKNMWKPMSFQQVISGEPAVLGEELDAMIIQRGLVERLKLMDELLQYPPMVQETVRRDSETGVWKFVVRALALRDKLKN